MNFPIDQRNSSSCKGATVWQLLSKLAFLEQRIVMTSRKMWRTLSSKFQRESSPINKDKTWSARRWFSYLCRCYAVLHLPTNKQPAFWWNNVFLSPSWPRRPLLNLFINIQVKLGVVWLTESWNGGKTERTWKIIYLPLVYSLQSDKLSPPRLQRDKASSSFRFLPRPE